MNKKTDKLSLKAAVVTKLQQNLSPDQLKKVVGGTGIGGGSAQSVC